MNYQPLTIYNFSAWCSIGPIYIVFSDDADWNQFTGNFKNRLSCNVGENGNDPRYFRSDFSGLSGGATCDFTHTYTPCADLLGLGNGDGLDFGYGGGTPTASWNECTPVGVLAVQYGMELQARRVGETVRLDWQTAIEVNSNRFEIMRSQDANGTFEKIGAVGAAGNSNAAQDYLWFDQSTPSGQVWYRLDEYDANGAVSSSNLASVLDDERLAQLEIKVQPDALHFLVANTEASVTVELFDMNGRMIAQQQGHAGDFKISRQALAAGVYIYQIRTGTNSFRGKVALTK